MQQSTKSSQQQDIQRQMEEFLAAGGKIKDVSPGETGEDPEQWSWNDSRYPKLKKRDDRLSRSR